MDSSELTTTITRKNAILRYIQGIADQRLPIRIACGDQDNSKVYRAQIARVAEDEQQIVIHQPKPHDWQKHIGNNDSLVISCRMPNGTIQFNGNLSLLEGNENSPYCQLTFPSELNKKQLRSDFRVSVRKYGSGIELSLPEDGTVLKGVCNDLSMGGLLVHLRHCEQPLSKGDIINALQLRIPDIIDLSCVARICRYTKVEGKGVFMGISFQSLDPQQANDLRAALIKLERQNIKDNPL